MRYSTTSTTSLIAVASLAGIAAVSAYKLYQKLTMGSLLSRCSELMHCPYKGEETDSIQGVKGATISQQGTVVCQQQEVLIPASGSGSQTPSDPSSPKHTPQSSPVTKEPVVQEVQLKRMEFVWDGEATHVQVAGSFLDDWKGRLDLHKTSTGEFVGEMTVAPGSHQFKFIVDGQWLISPKYATCDNGLGNVNNSIQS